jgi:histidinol-phosphatase (PHP family)
VRERRAQQPTQGSAASAATDFGQSRDLPLDSHLHTDLSPDSDVSIDVYAEQAADRGIAEIAITDHVDFDPRLPAFEYATYDDRLRIAREAAERWAPRGVTIRFGCELTYAQRREDAIRDHLRRHAYDFTIGSVHIGPDSPYHRDRVASFCAGRDLTEICGPYFDEVLAAAHSGLFDTLGHLDFVKRYIAGHIETAALQTAAELYEPVLRAVIDTGMALEINVSGLRQAAHETYPSEAIVALYRELGGTRVTTGSDAHRADSFAFGLDEGYRIAAATGYRSVAFRRGGSDAVEVAVPARFLARAGAGAGAGGGAGAEVA